MPAKFEKIQMSEEFLNSKPNIYYIFGDNTQKQGLDSDTSIRKHPRAISFVVRKAPKGVVNSCFQPEEYSKIFFDQLKQAATHITNNPQQIFYISRLGYGDANRHYIWERLVHHNLVSELGGYDNVVFCWEQEKLTSN